MGSYPSYCCQLELEKKGIVFESETFQCFGGEWQVTVSNLHDRFFSFSLSLNRVVDLKILPLGVECEFGIHNNRYSSKNYFTQSQARSVVGDKFRLLKDGNFSVYIVMKWINSTETKVSSSQGETKINLQCSSFAEVEVSRRFNQFLLGDLIGHGSFGNVYFAQDTLSGRQCVVKIMRHNQKLSPTPEEKEDQKSEEREMTIGMRLGKECPFLVNYEAASVVGKECIIVMEYCKGGDLMEQIDLHARGKRPFEEKLLVQFLFEMTSALKAIHDAGIMHRDIKPPNIYLTGTQNHKLGDYGTARYIKERRTLTTKKGSVDYMAPEVLDGNDDYDKSVDVYSLGVILLQMISLEHPFLKKGGVSMSSILTGKANKVNPAGRCSPNLVALGYRMISLNPAHRPSSDELLSEIKKLEDAEKKK